MLVGDSKLESLGQTFFIFDRVSFSFSLTISKPSVGAVAELNKLTTLRGALEQGVI